MQPMCRADTPRFSKSAFLASLPLLDSSDSKYVSSVCTCGVACVRACACACACVRACARACVCVCVCSRGTRMHTNQIDDVWFCPGDVLQTLRVALLGCGPPQFEQRVVIELGKICRHSPRGENLPGPRDSRARGSESRSQRSSPHRMQPISSHVQPHAGPCWLDSA